MDIIDHLNQEEKYDLFNDIKKEYALFNNGKDKGKCFEPLMEVSAGIISKMMPCKDYKDLVINVLRFMHNNIQDVEKFNENTRDSNTFAAPRDACNWIGDQVLAEGNFNGCVEAAVLFERLFSESASKMGFSSVEYHYISSFQIESAFKSPIYLAGHATVLLKQGEESFLVNASALEDQAFDPGKAVKFDELEGRSIIFRPDSNGIYKWKMRDENGNEITYHFKLFGQDVHFQSQRNPADPYDPSTSDGATGNAVRSFLISLGYPIFP